MSKRFDPNNYIDVAERIRRFYERHPEGRIVTKLENWGDQGIVFRALVYRDRTQPVDAPDATGWAHEVPGQGHVNQTNPVENCETSAIGRALANLGFPVKPGEPRPSREEMEGAQRKRREKDAAATPEQYDRIDALLDEREIDADTREKTVARVAGGLTAEAAQKAIEWLESFPMKERAA